MDCGFCISERFVRDLCTIRRDARDSDDETNHGNGKNEQEPMEQLKFTAEKGRVQVIIDVPAASSITEKDVAAMADILWYLARGLHQDACALMYERSRVNEDISATVRKKIVT